MLAQFDRGTILAEALNEIGGVEDALVFAAAADRDKCHFRVDELAERSDEASLSCVPTAGEHVGLRGGRRPRSTLLAANGKGHAFTERRAA